MRLSDEKSLLEQMTIEQFRQNLALLKAEEIEMPKKWVLELLNTIEALQQENKQLREIAKAKAEGRLVVLPCKAGDVVWKIKSTFSYFTKPMEDRVERIIISSNEILVCCTSGAKFSIGSIGKTVFLSREEAEKALEVKEP